MEPQLATQSDIFEALALDTSESERRKQEGIARVLANPDNQDWKTKFQTAVIRMARIGIPFTSEDIVAVVGMPPGNPNAIGASINALARQGWIARIGIRTATRTSAHGRYVSVWGPGPEVKDV